MFVVLEGIDGSGKGTQTKLLHERAEREGISTAHISFPQYGKNPFADVVSEYLNGAFGDVDEVHPKLSSLLFAGDRFASKSLLESALANHKLVVCDRYVSSNMAHQAAKLPEPQRPAFLKWLSGIEYGVYAMPKPDLTIYLELPVEVAQRLVQKKARRDQGDLFGEGTVATYTSLKADIHEQNESYLANCREMYERLCAENFGGPWTRVPCLRGAGSELRDASEIAEEVWSAASGSL